MAQKPDEPVDFWGKTADEREDLLVVVPIPTGLSDEADAPRWIERQLNPNLAFCPNCEGYFDMTERYIASRLGNDGVALAMPLPDYFECIACDKRGVFSTLRSPGTAPTSTRRKV